MKRSLVSFALLVVLVMGLCPSDAVGAENVYFTAVDVYMLEVTDETMPFWSGGYLYVDSRIFDGLTLDYGTLNHSRNISKQTVALYSTRNVRSLVFYLDSGKTIDGDGRTYHASAILKGDVVFVPAVIVANFFELRYSTIKVNHGTLVRLTVDLDPVLSDTAFANAASAWIEVRYEEYLKTQTSTSATSPAVTQPTVQKGQSIQLAFWVTQDAPVQSWLTALGSGQATFFFLPQDMEGHGDLLRQLLAQGHRIGLVADGAGETTIEDQLAQGNDLLYQATTTVSQLVWLVNGDVETAGVPEGYCVVTAQVDVADPGLLTANGASVTMSRIDAVDGDTTVWLGDTATTVGVSALVSYGLTANDQFRIVNQLVAG